MRGTSATSLIAAAIVYGACANAQVPPLPEPSAPVPVPMPPVQQPQASGVPAAGDSAPSRARGPLRIRASVGTEATLTDNVELQPNSTKRSDFVLQILPTLEIDHRGAHTDLKGTIAAPTFLYARTGSENNRVVPQVSLLGTVEVVDRFFFVEGDVHVSQEYFTPFGSRSVSLVNQTENEYTAQSYRVSPFIRGRTRGDIHYELRDNNIWTNLSGAPIATNNAYTNQAIATLSRDATPVGWQLDYTRTDVRFRSQQPQVTQIGRGRGIWRVDPQVELSASVGYESNDYPLTSTQGTTYGAGLRWRPTSRTKVDAKWEHRFFGSSYDVTFDHRTALTVWKVGASRVESSYPQLLARLPQNTIVPLVLDSLFASRISDPLQRAEFVLRFMQDRGLPFVLSDAVNLYTQQIFIEERASATVGWIGARNAVLLTAHRLRTEPVTASGEVLPPPFAALNNNTQTGVGVVWTYNFTRGVTLTTNADYSRSAANAPFSGTSDHATLRTVLTTSISPSTVVHAGARYQDFRSDFSNGWTEKAVYAGFNYTFH